MEKQLKSLLRSQVSKIEKFLRSLGVEIKKYPSSEHLRRINIVNQNSVNVIFDIGANEGQYLSSMRELGYEGKIFCFEPTKNAFDKLKPVAERDKNCDAFNYALGDQNGKTVIHISDNSQSSSISEILPLHIESAPSSKYVSHQEIEIKTIDSIFNSIVDVSDAVMLKIDVQGFEKNVLKGAKNSLDRIKVIQVEMSLFPLYKDSMPYNEMIEYIESKGFKLYSIEDVFSNRTTGQLLQIDGIFVKQNGFE